MKMWVELRSSLGGGVYHRRPDAMTAWRKGAEVLVQPEGTWHTGSTALIRLAAPTGDTRDVVDAQYPVDPKVLAAWKNKCRAELQREIDHSESALAEMDRQAAEVRQKIWLLKADLAALEGGGS